MTYDLEQMQAKCNVEQILTLLNIPYAPKRSVRGYELYIKCINPQHDDTNPSCSVAADGIYNGLFNCWACGEGGKGFSGNIYKLIKIVRDCSFTEAVKWLAGVTGTITIDGTEALTYKLQQLKPSKAKQDVTPDSERLLRLPATYTVNGLGSTFTKRAESYLSQRGISQLTQDVFKCGAADHPQIGYSVLIPIYLNDQLRNIFYCEPKRGGEKRYLRGVSTNPILFNYDNAVKGNSCILVESILDVLQMHTLGFEDGVSCLTNRLSKEQITLLRSLDDITVFPDLDNTQGWKLVEQCVKVFGKSIKVALPPIGKDPGDCNAGEMSKALNDRIKYSAYEVNCVLTFSQHEKVKSVFEVMKNSSAKKL